MDALYYYSEMNPTLVATDIQNRVLSYQPTALGTDGFATTRATFGQVYQDKIQAPATMDEIFEEAAAKYGIDVNLLKAIGKAESDFNPNAKSSAGAMGVMQLMPCNVTELGVKNPYDPRENIMAGAKHFSDMLSRYNGDVELALAAYNAGSGNVAKYGGIPPFRETQNYVKKVLQYAGTPITTGKTVNNAEAMLLPELSQSSRYIGYNLGLTTGNSQQNCEYLLEMMKLQINQQLLTASSGGSSTRNAFDLSEEEDEDWNLLL